MSVNKKMSNKQIIYFQNALTFNCINIKVVKTRFIQFKMQFFIENYRPYKFENLSVYYHLQEI